MSFGWLIGKENQPAVVFVGGSRAYARYRADVRARTAGRSRCLSMMCPDEPLVLCLDHLVALARGLPQRLDVGDGDLPAAIANDAGLPQRVRDDGDRIALDADHACEQLLRQR